MSVIVECQALTKTYKCGWFRRHRILALRALTWNVRSGERWAILGPNRAGKSTLLRLLVSLVRPTAGVLYRLGKPAYRVETLQQVGYVSEHANLPAYWTLEGLLRWSGILHGLTGSSLDKRVATMLDEFDLVGYSSLRVGQLSRGLRQRLALALAWLHQPPLLILDEPFDGLDNSGQKRLMELMNSTSLLTVTYILATHDWAFARGWASHALVLEKGELRYCGPIEYCDHEHRWEITSAPETMLSTIRQSR